MTVHTGYHGHPIEILLVEDNPGDVRLTLEIFKESNLENHVVVVKDGVEAMAYLYQQNNYKHAKRPDLILLDLNLPRKDGREVLAEIKATPTLRSIPVIVLTSSDTEQDIQQAYDLHANCYIAKPVDFEQLLHVVRLLKEFWFTVVKLPPTI
ncbi:MAG: response regulator [Caldilineaceae bacterium]